MSFESAKTSESHPIRVDYVALENLPTPGGLGMTFAPGKKAPGVGGAWERDLDADLARLNEHYRTEMLVSLLEEKEYERFGIAGLAGKARGLGMEVIKFAVPDGGTPPRSAEQGYADTIERIVAALRDGRNVVLFCRGGLGRTGTTAACVLAQAGHDPDEAVGLVREARGRGAVENAEQEQYVRRYAASRTPRRATIFGGGSAAAEDARLDRYRGALLGLAVGDALGAAVEFAPPGSFEPLEDMVGGGPHGLRAGEWTDDTSMALCLAESLVTTGGFDPEDQARRYLRWYRDGYMSSTGACFDIGGTTRTALERFEASGDPYNGPTGSRSAGNGSIMRLAPVAMYYGEVEVALSGDTPVGAVHRFAESSKVTHGARAAVDACRYLGTLICGALNGVGKSDLLGERYGAEGWGSWKGESLCPEIAEVAEGSFKHKKPPEIRGTGHAVRSLEAALWAFYRSESFAEGALLAVNLGDDADTTGAVYGQLAGAHYGASDIPDPWLDRLTRRDLIEAVSGRLYELRRSVDRQKLLEFLPRFERSDSVSGEEVGASGHGLTDETTGFIEALYASGAVVAFDWSEWHAEAERLFEDPRVLAAADEMTLRKLLTFHARKDRFAEGHLDEMLESGHITAILRRLQRLQESFE